MNKINARILVVDDDDNLRETLRDLLELEGYIIDEAQTGTKALELDKANDYQVILMDFNLDDMTGIDVIKAIRQTNKTSQILMMTAHASLDTAVQAIKESVYDFLIKPVNFVHLKNTIYKALEKFRLEQEIKNLLAELKEKNKDLVRLNDIKSKFLAMASHDLSNSLMTLQLSFEMLVSGLALSDDQKSKISYITGGLSQISGLINDLVDWASIEKGKFRLEKNYFEADKLGTELVEGIKARATLKEIAVETNLEPQLVISADRRRISQVLLNLLDNALRHTPKGGKITVNASKQGEDVLFSVTDTGDGITPEDAKDLFTSFYSSSDENKERGRLGLGLSISKEIVLSHDGKIWAASEGRQKGSTFSFTVPVKQEAGVIQGE